MTDITATVTQSTITATTSSGDVISIASPSSTVDVTVETGVQGEQGPSAYEVAVAGGFVGDETAWLASLKGDKGDKGDTGSQGLQGLQGVDGLSAYEVAVAGGFVGDEAAWLASLKGDKGDKGDTGATGPQGIQGDKGDKGDTGTAATIAAGTVTTGTPASVTNSGTSSAAVFDFVLPGDVEGPASATDGNLAVFDGTTGKLIKDGGAPVTTDSIIGELVTYGANNLATNSTFDVDATGWNVGTGWAWESDGGGGGWMRHTAGNTAVLSQDGALVDGVGYYYGVTVGGTTGTVTIAADDGDTLQIAAGVNGQEILSYLTDSGFSIKIYPSSDFDGYVDDIQIYRAPLLGEAKTNGKVYGRRLSSWVEITGASGTFTTADSKTVTVANGLITSIV